MTIPDEAFNIVLNMSDPTPMTAQTAATVPHTLRAIGDVYTDDQLGGIPLHAALTPYDTDTTFWASPDLCDLLADSADALDTIDLRTTPLISPSGHLVFATPVTIRSLLEDNTPQPIPVRAIRWFTGDDGVVNILGFVKLRNIPTQTLRTTPLGRMTTPWVPSGVSFAQLDTAHNTPGVQPLALLGVFSLLTQQAGVTDTTTEQHPSYPDPRAPRNTKSGKKTRKRVTPPPVRVVKLRAGTPTAHAYDTGAGHGREWRHRWIVRGHWRNQPYPSLGDGVTKQIWIAPYLKGPDQAPILTTPKVVAVKPPTRN